MELIRLIRDFDAIDDDIEVLEIIENGLPRQIRPRPDHFHNFDDLSFYKRFRLTKHTVLQLLILIEDRLEYPYDRNSCVAPMNQLLMTLRFYSTGTHLQCIADFGGVDVSTACRIIKRVSESIAALRPNYIKFPSTPEEIHKAQNDFYNIARFPRVIGAVDGTHVRIQSPGGNDAEVFRNRKNYFSINVQAICNAEMKIIDLVARWPGSTHDATIFNSCNKKTDFEENMYPNCLILGYISSQQLVNNFNKSDFVGDSAYNMRPYLFTPLHNPLGEGERLYNESHIRTRGIIEKTFGVWKRRFPILAYGCRLRVPKLLTIIVATAVLHNIARTMGEQEPPLPVDIEEHVLQQLIEDGQVPEVGINYNENVGPDARRIFINNYFAQL